MKNNKLVIDPATISEDLQMRLADELSDEHNLRCLAANGSKTVKLHVIWNANTPVQCLEKLAQDDSPEVRQEVASSNRTPLGTLKKLLKDDPSFFVKYAAKRTLQRLGEI